MRYDLEERTLNFAKRVIAYVNNLPKTLSNQRIGGQLTDSSGSVGANYIEVNESLSKKDFSMRVKISKKEAKESRYWLILTEPRNDQMKERDLLIQEDTELMKIFEGLFNSKTEKKVLSNPHEGGFANG